MSFGSSQLNWRRIWQKGLEDVDSAAVEKEASFSDGQELVKSEDELQLVELKHLNHQIE